MTILGRLKGDGTLHADGMEIPVHYELTVRSDRIAKSADGMIWIDGGTPLFGIQEGMSRLDLGGGRFVTVVLTHAEMRRAVIAVSGEVPGY